MKECLIYHWWGNPSDRAPHLNHRTPLIHSIATLRGVNQTIPVYVLDISDEQVDFHGWDAKLNFKVIKWKPILAEYHDKAGWKNLSRTHDVHHFAQTIPEDVIIYADSDVFWLSDPLPLHQNPDKFSFNKFNSGFWYYNKHSSMYKKFFSLYDAFIITSLNDDNFRVITRMYTDYNEWYYVLDETVLTYMYVKMPHLFNAVTALEHLVPSCNRSEITRTQDAKMIHLHGTMVENPTENEDWRKRHNRGIACLIIKELHDNMVNAIGIDGVKTMFDKEYGFFKQVSIHDGSFIDKFLNTKVDGMYHLNRVSQ